MLNEKPFLHPFKTPDSYYIYDVNTNCIIKTGKSVYEAFQDREGCIKNYSDGPIAILFEKMKKDGFLSVNRIEEMVHPNDEYLPYHLNRNISSITLQVTQNCNLRCSYCAYSGKYENRNHSNRTMSINTAKRGIDFLISHSADSPRINVGFYGGEPLLEFEMIKECIEYVEQQAEGKTVGFNITVNGTLLNERIIEYFIEHDVTLGISLDGPKEMHDKNRRYAANNCGTFDVVLNNLQKIREKYPDYLKKILFNMVLDPEADYGCLVDFVDSEDLLSESTLMISLINDKYSKEKVFIPDDFVTKVNYENFKVLLFKMKRLDVEFVSKVALRQYDSSKRSTEMLDKTFEGIPQKAHPSGPCTPGLHRLFMDVDGVFYPCERVSESSEVMKIGDIERGFDIEKVRSLLNIGKLTEEECKNCWAFRYCSLCAADADDLRELSKDKKSLRCNSVRRMVEDSFMDYCVLKELGFDSRNDLKMAVYL